MVRVACGWGGRGPEWGEQLQRVVEYVREWNTNSKHCHTAQRVLTAILQCHPPSALVQVGGWVEQHEGEGMQAA